VSAADAHRWRAAGTPRPATGPRTVSHTSRRPGSGRPIAAPEGHFPKDVSQKPRGLIRCCRDKSTAICTGSATRGPAGTTCMWKRGWRDRSSNKERPRSACHSKRAGPDSIRPRPIDAWSTSGPRSSFVLLLPAAERQHAAHESQSRETEEARRLRNASRGVLNVGVGRRDNCTSRIVY